MKKRFYSYFKIQLPERISKFYLQVGLIATLVAGMNAVVLGQTTWTGTASNAWLTTTNWSPATYPTGVSAQAYFNNNTQVSVGINMNTLSGALTIGALNYGTGATTARTLNNSSSATAGVLTLAGITLNSINNTVIWQQSSAAHNISNGTGTLGVALGNATDNVVAIDGIGSLTINSIISGTGKLTKSGTGTGPLILTGANTFSGGLVLNSGALQIKTSSAAFGTGNLTFNGGSFDNTNGGVMNLSPATLTQTWGSIVNFLDSSSLGMGTGAVTLTANSTVTVGANTLTVGGNIGGSFGITKMGAGILALGGTNTYTGKTAINAGTVSLSNESRFGTAPGAFTADQITLNGGTILSTGSFGFSSSNRGFTLGASGGTFNAASGHTITLTSVTTGSGALIKDGVGTLTMTGAHTYTGLTTVNAGVLNLSKAGGGTLPATNNITVLSGGTLVVTTNQTLNNLTVASGGTVTVNTGVTLTINGTYSVSSNTSGNAGTILINGNLQINEGGWPGNTGTFTYGSSGTLVFANTTGPFSVGNADTWWPASNGPANVTVQGGGGINLNAISRTVPSSGTTGTFLLVTGTNAVQGNALTLNGTVQINGGNFQSSPIYGSSSLLKYNVNATYGRNNEWSATGAGTIGTTPGYPNDVQLSNNTVLNFPNGSNTVRACARDLTIDAGCNLYADYSSGSVGLTVGRNISISGSISLGGSAGGDLTVGGNFTRTGTFTPNGRAVFFNAASGTQTITGATTFDYLNINNAAGTVTLANNVTVNNTLTFTSGNIVTGSNKISIGSGGSVSRTSGYVVGNLERYIPNSANPSSTFDIGDATKYTPVTLAFVGTTTGSGSITASTTAADHAQIATSGINSLKSVNRVWTLTNSNVAGFTSFNPIFTFLASDYDAGSTTANFVIGRYNASAWNATTAGTRAATTTQATGVTDFGDFQMGEAIILTTASISGSFCTGASVSVTYSTSPSLATGTFTAQLSDGSGSFSAPVTLGTGTSPIAVTIPANTTAGSGYKIRVINTAPSCAIVDNGANLTINARPSTAVLAGDATICNGSTANLTTTITGGTSPYTVVYSGGTVNSYTSGAAITVNPTTTTTYTLTSVTDANSCTVATPSGSPSITVNPIPSVSLAQVNDPCQISAGTITVTITGGTPNYTITACGTTIAPSPTVGQFVTVTGSPATVTTNGGSKTFSNLQGNTTYKLTVTDTNGCIGQ